MTAYYNEFDPFAAAWLRELIKDGLIADGEVDERSIADVQADDLSGFDQVHFFAGIGGWSYALRLAGIDDDEPVWTGSCPCQPFSSAGKRKGVADERHLWPEMFRLVRECRPATVFGEQVEAAIRLGWVDGVRGDLERENYAFGFHVLGAHSVESPHIRQRIYWVADNESERRRWWSSGAEESARRRGIENNGSRGRLVDADGTGSQQVSSTASATRYRSSVVSADRGTSNRLEHSASDGRQQGRAEPIGRGTSSGCGNGWLGDTNSEREGEIGRVSTGSGTERTRGPWGDSRVILCRDGKQRRIPAQPELFPLAYGVSNRVGTLRGAGNAIVPQVAAEFIKACYEVTNHRS